jgi:hypothetical protein
MDSGIFKQKKRRNFGGSFSRLYTHIIKTNLRQIYILMHFVNKNATKPNAILT